MKLSDEDVERIAEALARRLPQMVPQYVPVPYPVRPAYPVHPYPMWTYDPYRVTCGSATYSGTTGTLIN